MIATAPAVLLAFAAAGLVPMALALADEPDRAGKRSPVLARRLVWPGAALLILSMAMEPGAWAAALAAPWLLLACALVWLLGLRYLTLDYLIWPLDRAPGSDRDAGAGPANKGG